MPECRTAATGRELSWADYDLDGKVDLYVANNGNNHLFRNDGQVGNWLTVTLTGGEAATPDSLTNKAAIGVEAVAVTGSGQLHRFVHGGDVSQSSLSLEFGLGTETTVNSLTVKWLSGEQVLNSVAANQFLTLSESPPCFTEVGSAAGVDDGGAGLGVAWGDYDGDGDQDLYVVNSNSANRLYRNEGNRTFTELVSSAGVADAGAGVSAVWGDFDNDGDLDLYLNMSGSANRLYRNDGSDSFTDIASSGGVADTGTSQGASWIDYNTDGLLDLFVANTTSGGTSNRLYENNGDETFTDVAPSLGLDDGGNGNSAPWADYDGDGDLDLYVVNANGSPARLYRNNGDGTYTEVATTAGVDFTGNATGAEWGDHDNDGDFDLLVAVSQAASLLYRNNGDGTFTDVASSIGLIVSSVHAGLWGDYDYDGDLDVYFVVHRAANLLYENQGGTFVEVGAEKGVNDGGGGRGGGWADYDGDGDIDLHFTNDHPTDGIINRLYRNEVGTANKWLVVKARGTTSNRDGVGARVVVVTGSLRQVRHVDGGSGYYSQPSFPVEFGVGQYGYNRLTDRYMAIGSGMGHHQRHN